MPALEILDLSKNRLTTFPDQPGRLSLLKVLSLTNNKIYTLPIYLTKFEALKVFKVDNNPIEWPVSHTSTYMRITFEADVDSQRKF